MSAWKPVLGREWMVGLSLVIRFTPAASKEQTVFVTVFKIGSIERVGCNGKLGRSPDGVAGRAPHDFVALVSSLGTASLQCRFADSLDREMGAAAWYRVTEGKWEPLQELVTCLSNVLNELAGDAKEAVLRIIDEQTLNEAYHRFNQRQQPTPPA